MSRPSSGTSLSAQGLQALDPAGADRMMKRILATMAAAAAAGLVVALIYDDTPVIIATVAALLALPPLGLAVKRGRQALAALGTSTLILVVACWVVLTGGGVHDPGITLFALAIVVYSSLLNRKLAWIFSGLTVVAATSVGIAEMLGWLTTQFTDAVNWADVLNTALLLVTASIVVVFLNDALYRGLRRALVTEQSYREIFNATHEGILVLDPDTGSIIDANDACSRIGGYSRAELLSQGLRDIVGLHPEQGRTEIQELLHRTREQGPQVFEWNAQRKDGQEIWTEVALRSAVIGGQPRILAVLRDTTERRAMTEQLRQTEKLQAVGQLAGGIAHDFNNQLTGILANATLLQTALRSHPSWRPIFSGGKASPASAAGASDARLQQYVDAIIQCSERSAELTRQLLAFARKGRRQERSVDFNELIADVTELLRRSIDKRIEIQCDPAPERAAVKGDPTFLQNALLNLGLNARDAMPNGGKLTFQVQLLERSRIVASTTRGDERYVCVRVTDTGQGMSDDVKSRIFEPFFTTKSNGNGMGLAAVYGTTEAHGGSINVVSSVGRGTTFELVFPADTDVDSVRSAKKEENFENSFSGLRVLLVEDEPQVAQVATALLGHLGCKVRHVADGDEGLAQFQQSPDSVDLMMLDHSLPGLSGAEILERVRKLRPTLPVVTTSGYAQRNRETQDAPVHVFLPKPYSLERLRDALRDVLAQGTATE